MDNGSSTYSPSTHMTDECRSARNTISAARELYLERIQLVSRRNIKCERAELLMILRYYLDHSGDYGSIVDEIIYNKSQLSAQAAELYSETPKIKLKSRVRSQIYLFPSKKRYFQDEEISREFKAVRKMQEDASTKVLNSPRETTAASKGTEPSDTTAPLTKDKRVDGAAEDPKDEGNDATTKYKYPFENLVLKGGGVKGIAYCGLIKVLEEHGILQQMKRFAGTSAGAITAALLAVGYNSCDVEKILGVDFDKLVNDSRKIMWLRNLYWGYGVNTGDRFEKFIGDLLDLKTEKSNATFEEVYYQFNTELCIVVVNVDTSEEMYCHVKTTPHMRVRFAVRMSMSIPGLFQAVKYEQSYFVDGGLLCNYPIHCFDGWFLSMEVENRFFNKIPSLNDLQEITSFENSFKKDPENKTIGGMVYCDEENISYRKMLEQSTGVPLGELPNTVLASKYEKVKFKSREDKEIFEKTIEAVIKFYQVLREKDNNGRINRDKFMSVFNEPSFTAEYKTLLFGGEYENSGLAWTAVNKHKRDEIQFTDITSFIESIGVSMLKAFKGCKRKDTSNVFALLGAMILGLSESTMQHFFKSTDVERSVGINTWYVQTTNFKLEEGDKKFLTNQGRESTMKFLKKFKDINHLRVLTEIEKSEICISDDVDKTEFKKIIEGDCTVSTTLTTIVIVNIQLFLLCGLLYVDKIYQELLQ